MNNYSKLLLAAFLVVLIIVSRWLSPFANFAAVGAVALFGGYVFTRKIALVVLFSGLFLSDLLIEGLYDAGTMLAVYTGFAAAVWIGAGELDLYPAHLKTNRFLSILVKAISGGIIFFLVSNLGVFFFSGMYALSLAGLAECYLLAIPFFKFTWLGDLAYSLSLFGAYYVITDQKDPKKLIPVKVRVKK